METNSALLRQFRPTDLSSLKLIMMDKEVMRYTGFKKAQAQQEIHNSLAKWCQSEDVWAAIEKSTNTLFGWFMLKKNQHNDLELGLMLMKSYWGQGLACDISRVLLSYAFETLKTDKVVALVNSENTASIRVLEKLGMVQTKSTIGHNMLHFELTSLIA